MTAPTGPMTGDDLVALAKRKGLQWQLRPATVAQATSGTSIQILVTMDGDTEPVPAFTLVGALSLNDRVMTVEVQPEGIYVVGFYRGGSATIDKTLANCSVDSQTTTSATFVNMACAGSAFAFSFIKHAPGTGIEVDFRAGGFVQTSALTTVQHGININGTDYDTAKYFYNTTLDHRAFSSLTRIDGIPAGTYTVTVRWRRSAGGGTLTADTSDLFSVGLSEVV